MKKLYPFLVNEIALVIGGIVLFSMMTEWVLAVLVGLGWHCGLLSFLFLLMLMLLLGFVLTDATCYWNHLLVTEESITAKHFNRICGTVDLSKEVYYTVLKWNLGRTIYSPVMIISNHPLFEGNLPIEKTPGKLGLLKYRYALMEDKIAINLDSPTAHDLFPYDSWLEETWTETDIVF